MRSTTWLGLSFATLIACDPSAASPRSAQACPGGTCELGDSGPAPDDIAPIGDYAEAPSCLGWCGAAPPLGTCACDALCVSRGDCCPDVLTQCDFPTGSCADACGVGQVDDCWCDALCEAADDCCADYVSECGNVSSSCAGACDGPSADRTCWCDDNCAFFGDCCDDRDDACGSCDGSTTGDLGSGSASSTSGSETGNDTGSAVTTGPSVTSEADATSTTGETTGGPADEESGSTTGTTAEGSAGEGSTSRSTDAGSDTSLTGGSAGEDDDGYDDTTGSASTTSTGEDSSTSSLGLTSASSTEASTTSASSTDAVDDEGMVDYDVGHAPLVRVPGNAGGLSAGASPKTSGEEFALELLIKEMNGGYFVQTYIKHVASGGEAATEWLLLDKADYKLVDGIPKLTESGLAKAEAAALKQSKFAARIMKGGRFFTEGARCLIRGASVVLIVTFALDGAVLAGQYLPPLIIPKTVEKLTSGDDAWAQSITSMSTFMVERPPLGSTCSECYGNSFPGGVTRNFILQVEAGGETKFGTLIKKYKQSLAARLDTCAGKPGGRAAAGGFVSPDNPINTTCGDYCKSGC